MLPRGFSVACALLDEARGGEAFHKGNNADFPAPGADFCRADDRVGIVVAAFDDDIGADGDDEFKRRGLVEDDDSIDGGKSGQDAGALGLADDRTIRAFEAADGCVAVDGDDEPVAEATSLLEQCDVADVQQIEAAVGKDDALAVGFPEGDALRELIARRRLYPRRAGRSAG